MVVSSDNSNPSDVFYNFENFAKYPSNVSIGVWLIRTVFLILVRVKAFSISFLKWNPRQTLSLLFIL